MDGASATRLRNVEWVATLVGKTPGDNETNPHHALSRRWLTSLDQPRGALLGSVASDPAPEWSDALAQQSPFESASRLLVHCQNSGGDLAQRVRDTLHPVLHSQLDAEMRRSLGLFAAFARNMAGMK